MSVGGATGGGVGAVGGGGVAAPGSANAHARTTRQGDRFHFRVCLARCVKKSAQSLVLL